MPKAPERDRSTVYTVAIAAFALAIGFGTAWLFQKRQHVLAEQVVYSKPTRVVAGTEDYSVAMSFAVKTSGDDAGWMHDHRQALEQIAKKVLISDDARRALKPGGLRELQRRLREEGNAGLRTDKLQQVIITDFLIGESS